MRTSAGELLGPLLIASAILGLLLPSAGASGGPCAADAAAQSCCCESQEAAPVEQEPSGPGHEDCTPLCRALCGHMHAFSPPPLAAHRSIRVVAAQPAPPLRPVLAEDPGCLFRPPRSVL